MTTEEQEQTMAQQTAQQIAEIDRAEAAAIQRSNNALNRQINSTFTEGIKDFIVGQRQRGVTVVEWSDLTRQEWDAGGYVVYEYAGDFYWVGPRLTSITAAKTAGVTVSAKYEPGGFLIIPPGGISPLHKLKGATVFAAQEAFDEMAAHRAKGRRAADDKAEGDKKAWFDTKRRDYAPAVVHGFGTAFTNPSISVLKAKMEEYGITAARSKTTGRVLVSRPDGPNPLRNLSSSTFDMACRFAEYVADKPGHCQAPKCMKTGDIITDSGATICRKHARIG